jgi:hypothetical protein
MDFLVNSSASLRFKWVKFGTLLKIKIKEKHKLKSYSNPKRK